MACVTRARLVKRSRGERFTAGDVRVLEVDRLSSTLFYLYLFVDLFSRKVVG